MEGDHPESAEEKGRICSICSLPKEEDLQYQPCSSVGPAGADTGRPRTWFIRVIESLKLWSQEIPTWDILHWLHQLLQPSISRARRKTGARQGLFIVFEGIDGSGKTFIWTQYKSVWHHRNAPFIRWSFRIIVPNWDGF